MSGLKVPHSAPFGDPEILPIMSARAQEVVSLSETLVEFEGVPSNITIELDADGIQAVEISLIGIEHGHVKFMANGSAENGIERVVPKQSQVIEYRRALTGDTLNFQVLSGSVKIQILAHLGA